MTLSDRHSADPGLRRAGGLRPTDRSVPLARRTHPAPYILALAAVFVIGLALIAFGVVRFSQSTGDIENSSDAASTTENLLPSTGAENDAEPKGPAFDREVQPTGDAAPDEAVPAMNAEEGLSGQ